MILDRPDTLLFIEPTTPAHPIEDDLSRFADHLQSILVSNGDATRGVHQCSCGARSTNVTYTLATAGSRFLTNSLLAHYARHHRAEATPDLRKIQSSFESWLRASS